MSKQRQGINPITLPGLNKQYVTISRTWLGQGHELDKLVTVVVWRENNGPEILATVVINEDSWIDGLLHLFPNQEFSDQPPTTAELSKQAMDKGYVTGVGDDPERLRQLYDKAEQEQTDE